MNSTCFRLVFVAATLHAALCPRVALAQTNQTQSPTTLVQDRSGVTWSITPLDWMSSRSEADIPLVNPAPGQARTTHTQFITLASGLNYQDSTGQWQPSLDLIEIQSDGSAAANYGPGKVRWLANLNTSSAATFSSVSNRVFQTRILGLVYYDAASGKSVVVSPIQDSFAELEPPNRLIYRSAFASINADVLCEYTKSGWEMDVLLRQRPNPPSAYGLSDDSTRLQIWHEWTAPSEPQIKRVFLYTETNAALRTTMVEPDLTAQILDFGDLWFPIASTRLWDSSTNWDPNTPAEVRVHDPSEPGKVASASQWYTVSNTWYLIESVRWPDVAANLANLPPVASSTPAAPRDAPVQFVGLHPPQPAPTKAHSKPVRLAASPYRGNGFLWPYTIVPSSGTTYEFFGSSTYNIAGSTYFSGNVTLDASCYIKYASNAYLLSYGGFTFNGSSTSPSICTSMDDPNFGSYITNATGNPTNAASQAIWSYYLGSGITINGVWIRWAQTGVQLDENPGTGVTHTFSNSSIQFSNYGIYADNCTVDVTSSSKCTVGYDLYNSGGTATFVGSLSDICSGNVSGIPDTWFVNYFGAVGTATANPSGDGLNNQLDYTLGLNPTYNSIAQATNRAVYGYTLAGWLTNAIGTKTGAVTLDREGNTTQSTQ